MKAWKRTEKNWEDILSSFGKDVFVHRFSDTAAAKATGGRSAIVAAQPSDYLVTLKGETWYAEVKHSEDDHAFHFSKIRKFQWASSKMIVKAGGGYFFWVYSKFHLRWHLIPAHVLHQISETKKHATWVELEDYVYEI